jgi:hypothetical protein
LKEKIIKTKYTGYKMKNKSLNPRTAENSNPLAHIKINEFTEASQNLTEIENNAGPQTSRTH